MHSNTSLETNFLSIARAFWEGIKGEWGWQPSIVWPFIVMECSKGGLLLVHFDFGV